MTNEKALTEFMLHIAEISERLTELKEFADEHMSYLPEEINWGHVGKAGYFLKRLNELADNAYQRGEFAD